MENTVDSTSFRQIMGCFATGIAVVTSHNAEFGSFGLTINSLTSLSLKPPLLLFCLDKAAHLYPAFVRAESFAINFLAADQEPVSRHFASRDDKARIDDMWSDEVAACPVLSGTLGWALCRRYAHHDGGDHTIFVGEVSALHKNPVTPEPLLYFAGRYRELAEARVPSDNVISGARK